MTAAEGQPLTGLPASVKLTVPVGALPVTVAVKVTLLPAVAGLGAPIKAVDVGVGPGPALPHASTSVMRDQLSTALATLIWILLVLYAAKLTQRLTRLLP